MLAFLALSAVSVTQATNLALAQRALLITIASCAFFISAAGIPGEHDQQIVLAGVAGAGIVVALSVLLEAGGIISRLSLPNRGFGGTFLHRNHASHFIVCVLPATYWLASSRWRPARWWGLSAGLVIAAAIVVTRTRASWLAFGTTASLLGIVTGLRIGRRDAALCWDRLGIRTLIWMLALLVGVLSGAWLCKRIQWSSPRPLRQSLVGLFDARSGSGRGRILQDRNTASMIGDHWVLGVGPGNWAMKYPSYASRGDPSLLTGMKATDDQPRSDWLGIASERGVPALLALFCVFGQLLYDARNGSSSNDYALLGAAAGLAVLGSLDAVLLTAAPSAVMFAQLGVYAPSRSSAYGERPRLDRRSVAVVILALALWIAPSEWALIRSNDAIKHDVSEVALRRAVLLQPQNYQAQVLLAMRLAADRRCAEAVPHLRRAAQLQPFASLPRELANGCGVSTEPAIK
jgi:O-antigen ligase